MNKLLKVFVDICLFRAGPQQLPASAFLLGLALAVHWLIDVVLELFSAPLVESLLMALLDTLLPLAVVYGLLLLYRRPARLEQTATALLGSEVLLDLPLLPLSAWVVFGAADPTLPSLLSLLLLVWAVAVAAHILHHALNVNRAIAAAYAVVYTVLSYALTVLAVHGG